MSMLIFENEKMLSFSEFCLSESISPKKVPYGTNSKIDNLKFDKNDNILYTFFESQNNFYLVTFLESSDKQSVEIGFGVSDQFSKNLYDYTADRQSTRNALSVLSNILYIVFEIVSKLKFPDIKFESANPALGSVYARMVQNKFVLKYIEDYGYHYNGIQNGFYTFFKS